MMVIPKKVCWVITYGFKEVPYAVFWEEEMLGSSLIG